MDSARACSWHTSCAFIAGGSTKDPGEALEEDAMQTREVIHVPLAQTGQLHETLRAECVTDIDLGDLYPASELSRTRLAE
jgi:hypothetical protein